MKLSFRSLIASLNEPNGSNYPEDDEGSEQDSPVDLVTQALIDAAFQFEWVSTVRSYEEAMMLTHDKGFVIKCDDGSEYQITVVQRR